MLTQISDEQVTRPSRQLVGVVVAGLLVAGLFLTWAIGTARYGGPDEAAHVIRAAAVADGDVLGVASPRFASGFRVVQVPARLGSGDPACYRHDARTPASCADEVDLPGLARIATAAGIYPPVYYALVGFPVRWFGDPGRSIDYRFAAVILNGLVAAAVVARLRVLGRRSLAAVAWLLPAAWFLFGVVNPNGLEILLAMLAWAGVARIWRGVDGITARSLLWVSAPIAAAIAIRPVAIAPWATMCAALVVSPIGRSALRRWVWWIPPVLAIVWLAAWNAIVDVRFDDDRSAVTGGRWQVLGRSLGGTWATLREAVGSLGWLEFSAPLVAQGLAWIALAAVAVSACRERRSRWPVVAVVAGSLLIPVAFEVLYAPRVGLIWQGRYTISSIAGLAAIALAAARREPSRALVALGAVAVAVVEVVTFVAVVHRGEVGVDGDWWPSDRPVLIAAHVALVASTLLASLVWTTSRRDRSRPDVALISS